MPESHGKVHCFDGETGICLETFSSINRDPPEGFGRVIAGLGNLAPDRAGDLLVGVSNHSPGPSPMGAGRAYIFQRTGRISLLERMEQYDVRAGGRYNVLEGVDLVAWLNLMEENRRMKGNEVQLLFEFARYWHAIEE
jgi:hypothetical protein